MKQDEMAVLHEKILNLSLDDLRRWAGSKILTRGKSYRKHVSNLTRTGDGGLPMMISAKMKKIMMMNTVKVRRLRLLSRLFCKKRKADGMMAEIRRWQREWQPVIPRLPWFYLIPNPSARLSEKEKADFIQGLRATFGEEKEGHEEDDD